MKFPDRFLLSVMIISIGCLFFASMTAVASEFPMVGDSVFESLRAEGEVHVIVSLTRPNVNIESREIVNELIADRQKAVLSKVSSDEVFVKRAYKSISSLALILKSEKALFDLLVLPEVEHIDIDMKNYLSLNQSRPRIHADDVHAMGIRGAGRVVAVIDSGIDTNHPDLSDHINYEICFCFGGCCPNGANTQQGNGASEDQNGHGTHVSGIITSRGANAPLGIAPDAGIVAIKTSGSDGTSYSSDNIAALDWIYNNRQDIDAVNMSLGSEARYPGNCDNANSTAMSYAEAINNLRSVGILVCAATGNDSDPTGISLPGCISNAIAVGATWDNQERVAVFSNSSPSLDVLAPGRQIESSAMGGGSVSWNGTSMATPHVTAAVALLKQNNPGLSAAELESALETSPVNLTDSRNGITAPRLDVLAAINAQAPDVMPVHRFWSDRNQRHFYTISETEFLYIQTNYSDYIWHYEGVSWYASPNSMTGMTPVFRFWSDSNQSHFYTASDIERDFIQNNYPDSVWRYEQIAWYVNMTPVTGTSPVYRFWSPVGGSHFYTISEEEKDHLNATAGDVWTYEGVVWYSVKP